MQRHVALVIHDVSPLTLPACQQLVGLVEDVAGAIPLTLLIIPHHHRQQRIDHSAPLRRWVDHRLAKGDELALHGLWHRDDGPPPRGPRQWFDRRILTAGEAEFAALDGHQAGARIEQGLKLFQACGWSAAGFVPPAWQLSQAAQLALSHYPFAYTATLNAIISLPTQLPYRVSALSVSARSRLRRQLSRGWMQLWLRLHHRDAAARIALHPIDALFPSTRDAWQRCLQSLLPGTVFVTKSRLAQRRMQ